MTDLESIRRELAEIRAELAQLSKAPACVVCKGEEQARAERLMLSEIKALRDARQRAIAAGRPLDLQVQ